MSKSNEEKEFKKWIITFGSGQLPEVASIINPMNIMLIVEAPTEGIAREKVFNSFIGRNFCTSYPYEPYAKEFKEKYRMIECKLDNLIKYVEEDEQTKNMMAKNFYELKDC